MRLATPAPVPVVSLGLVSIVTGLLAGAPGAPPAIEPVIVELENAPEEIAVREQLYMHHEPPPVEMRVLEHHSVWEGTYVCLQGLSSVKLTVDVDARGNARARYDFGPTPSNPDIPKTGAFVLEGTLVRTEHGFTAELDPTRWIVHPEDYIMAHLSLDSRDGVNLTGTIHYDGCSDFEAKRTR